MSWPRRVLDEEHDSRGSRGWQWCLALVKKGCPLRADDLTDYYAAMKRADAREGVLFTAPTVQTIVGRRT